MSVILYIHWSKNFNETNYYNRRDKKYISAQSKVLHSLEVLHSTCVD